MIPFLDEAAVRRALPPRAAVAAIEASLRAGLDPADDAARISVPAASGEMLLMPAQSVTGTGVKIVTVAPGNPDRGLPRIHGVYVLFDGATLRPAALLDGAALTTLRTPAVSVAAVRPVLERIPDPVRLVVFGAGPQGRGHVEAVAAVHDVERVDVVVRKPEAADPAGTAGAFEQRLLRAGSGAVEAALREADVVVCATTAREPLFDSTLLRDGVIVVAVGAHEPAAREVDAAWCARASVVVEDPATALRECGDVVLAVEEGALEAGDLIPMREVVRGEVPDLSAPLLYKGSGMSWQDLVVAEAVVGGAGAGPSGA